VRSNPERRVLGCSLKISIVIVGVPKYSDIIFSKHSPLADDRLRMKKYIVGRAPAAWKEDTASALRRGYRGSNSAGM
jgi:hypothetical protein